ncbi:MAG: tungsten ABC transporter substrate-binding protein [Chloroflexi bacterium]|nr:tungsten ABC transporter substrate-binding protein [Chloroflexota bacterium]
MRTALAVAALAALVAVGCGARAAGPVRPNVALATTTSFLDSGLLDALIGDFQKRTGYKVKAQAVGTGAALAIGSRGDADVVVSHAPGAEREFMAAGNGERRHLFMHNDFVLAGPPADPAALKGLKVLEGLKRLAASGVPFVSRGDRSGTHLLEMELWQKAGVAPRGAWYLEAATGMGQTLTIASEKRAYTLTDRGTYVSRRAQLELAIVIDRDPPLLNPYHVITVSPKKFPAVNAAGANAFADYLLSARAQSLISTFGIDRYGEQLFFADAGIAEEDLR